MKARTSIPKVYDKLFAANGKQHWWPGDTAFEIMISAVLTQNTAWTNVEKAIVNLKKAKALTPEAIVKAPHPELAPQAPGLMALSLGLSRNFPDDHEMLKHGMVMYDALYAWCRSCQKETHGWPPKV